MEEVCRFPELPVRKPLTYQAKQLVAQEILVEKMRRVEVVAQAGDNPQVSPPQALGRVTPGRAGPLEGTLPLVCTVHSALTTPHFLQDKGPPGAYGALGNPGEKGVQPPTPHSQEHSHEQRLERILRRAALEEQVQGQGPVGVGRGDGGGRWAWGGGMGGGAQCSWGGAGRTCGRGWLLGACLKVQLPNSAWWGSTCAQFPPWTGVWALLAPPALDLTLAGSRQLRGTHNLLSGPGMGRRASTPLPAAQGHHKAPPPGRRPLGPPFEAGSVHVGLSQAA